MFVRNQLIVTEPSEVDNNADNTSGVLKQFFNEMKTQEISLRKKINILL